MMIGLLRLFAVLVLATAAPAYAQSPAPKAAAAAKSVPAKVSPRKPADALKGLRRSHDEMQGVSWYYSPSSPKYRSRDGVYLYFGRTDEGRFTSLRFVMQYVSDDWLFVQRAWARADGAKVSMPQTSKFLGWGRDNGSEKIWEWTDAPLESSAEIAAVRQLASAKAVTVRFEGQQYYADKKLSAKQLQALHEVIAAYEAATGKPLK